MSINHQHHSALNRLHQHRQRRVRAKIRGTSLRPRLNIFRSNRFTYLQVIDDQKGLTLASQSEKQLSKTGAELTGTKSERAERITTTLAQKLVKARITRLRFDRSWYRYHGRLQIVAATLRAAGIQV